MSGRSAERKAQLQQEPALARGSGRLITPFASGFFYYDLASLAFQDVEATPQEVIAERMRALMRSNLLGDDDQVPSGF